MLVRQLIGVDAGKIIEMDYAVFKNCEAAGTACEVGQEPKIRGLVLAPENVDAAPEASEDGPDVIVVPDNWEKMSHKARKALAEKITGKRSSNPPAANAAIRVYLES